MADKAAQLKKKLLAPKPEKVVDWTMGLSSGCTLLNLACTGRLDVAFLPGHYYCLPGDTSSGKTWLVLQAMAEAARNPKYDSYDLIFDQPERGALMDKERFFGKRLADRLKPPYLGRPSKFLEEFYDQVDDAADSGRPFIYGLDSEDSLVPLAEYMKMEEDKKARRKALKEDKDPKLEGSYGTARAKTNSSYLRVANNQAADTNSILFVIKQSRDRIGFGSQFDPKTKSGGNAITFYATDEIWFSVRGDIKRSVRGHNMIVGKRLRMRVEKNRQNGRERTVEMLFYPTVGFDDIGSMVSYLMDYEHWDATSDKSGKVTSVKAPEFDFEGKPEALIEKIEADNAEKDLKLIVKEVWDSVEAACAVTRKPRYAD